MKYLRPRGNSFQFERSVPKDVRDVLGIKSWREGLWTDSRSEAERLCRKRIVETDEIIQSVRSGSFRRLDDHALHDLAIQWSIDFQHINRSFMPADMFPDVIESQARIGDEAPNSIFRSREEIAQSVLDWLERTNVSDELLPNEFNKLVDLCLDEYLVSNPELSDGWKDVIGDSTDEKIHLPRFAKVVERTKSSSPRRRLSEMFRKYVAESDIGGSAEHDFGLGVRRFIELHGDIDVNAVSRRHVEDFRDVLRGMPSRPPNDIRKLPMVDQVLWAEKCNAKRFSQATINKNIGGVKVTLSFAFDETSEIENRDWRNPCDGFSKKPKKSSDKVRAFKPDEIGLVFSKDVHQTRSVEKFWIPVVLFYTGARLDEISQLHVEDIRSEPVPHLVCENLDDDDPALSKKVKSISANRSIPIHRDLIELGFLDYVQAIADNSHRHVFPDLPHHNGRKRGNKISRAFITSYRKYGEAHPNTGLNTKQLVTHSLRHTFRTCGFRGRLDQEFVQVVMGHFVGGVSYETYGDEVYHMPDILAERVMDEIQLPEIDLTFLKSEADRYLEQLVT